MSKMQTIPEAKLAALSKRCREQAEVSRAQAARDMGVSQTSIFQAEEMPAQALVKLRVRMIEMYASCKVTGPVFILEKK